MALSPQISKLYGRPVPVSTPISTPVLLQSTSSFPWGILLIIAGVGGVFFFGYLITKKKETQN